MTARKGRFERRLSRHISILDRSRKTKTNSTRVQRSCPKLVHHPKRRLFCAKNGRERKEYWFSRVDWQKATSFLRRWPSPCALQSRERKLFLNWTARIFRYQLEQFSEQKSQVRYGAKPIGQAPVKTALDICGQNTLCVFNHK